MIEDPSGPPVVALRRGAVQHVPISDMDRSSKPLSADTALIAVHAVAANAYVQVNAEATLSSMFLGMSVVHLLCVKPGDVVHVRTAGPNVGTLVVYELVKAKAADVPGDSIPRLMSF